MADPPPFVYDALSAGDIRLLTPASSETASGHTWKIQTVGLDQPDLKFDALSYVWGSASELLNITLNGCVAQVHRNLFTALPYLARRGAAGTVRPIWIDAICINQADHEEKMLQIREMNRVYRQAKKVWVWLGSTAHQEYIPEAIQFLRRLSDERHSTPEKYVDELVQKNFDTLDVSLKPALHHLILNAWFGRLWIVQEATLARKISFLCGDSKMSWKLMRTSIKDGRLFWALKSDLPTYEHLLHLSDGLACVETRATRHNGTVFHLRAVVHMAWNCEGPAADSCQAIVLALAILTTQRQQYLRPEDRILGLLGLIDPKYLKGTYLDPEIAYVSVEDLFTRFTKFILETSWKHGSTLIWGWFSFAFRFNRRKHLPSWVPDFHDSEHLHRHMDLSHSRTSRYARVSRYHRSLGGSKLEQLVLTGKVLDDVVKVFAMMPSPSPTLHLSYKPGSEEREYLRDTAMWEETLAHDTLGRTCISDEKWPQVEVRGQGTLEEYWRMLVDRQECYRNETITQDWYLDFRALGRQLKRVPTGTKTERKDTAITSALSHTLVEDSEEIPSTEHQHKNAYKFLAAMCEVFQKQFFKTREGHFSLTTQGVRPGDVLVALNGAPILHVIRRNIALRTNEPETWKFVGEAYLPETVHEDEPRSPPGSEYLTYKKYIDDEDTDEEEDEGEDMKRTLRESDEELNKRTEERNVEGRDFIFV